MKKSLLLLVLIFGLCSSLSAYELNGKLGVTWTGYKTMKKAPVSGTFKETSLHINSHADLAMFLKSAQVEISALSFDSKNPMRDKNITSTLFSLASAAVIKGNISKVNTTKNTLLLNVTMNEVTNVIPMNYVLKDNMIVATGQLDILSFKMKDSFLAFAQKCAAFHQNKSFSDVGIKFTIPFK